MMAETTHPKKRWETRSLIANTTLSAPAIRMMIVEAFAWSEHDELKCESVLYPVIALESRITHRYSRRRIGDERTPPGFDHAEMHELGWIYEGQEMEVGAVFYEAEEYGLASTLDQFVFGAQTAWQIVVCAWDATEDAEKLAPTIAKLQHEAIDKTRKLDKGAA